MSSPCGASRRGNEMKHVLTVLLATTLFTSYATAANEGKHVFLLSGQSNMVLLDPDLSFTPAVIKAFGKENVIVIKDAVYAQPIRQWYEASKTATGKLYDRLLTKAKAAMKDKQITSITFVWMQGERDAREWRQDSYSNNLKGLVEKLREDLDSKNMKVVIGRLSDSVNWPSWMAIRKIQQELSEADAGWEWVDTDDLNGPKNDLHYTADGFKKLGKRFADKAVGLINGEPGKAGADDGAISLFNAKDLRAIGETNRSQFFGLLSSLRHKVSGRVAAELRVRP